MFKSIAKCTFQLSKLITKIQMLCDVVVITQLNFLRFDFNHLLMFWFLLKLQKLAVNLWECL